MSKAKKKLEIKSGAKTVMRDMFAKYLAKGYKQQEAYVKAGFSSKHKIAESSRLKGELDVKEAYNYYLALEAKPLDISSKSIVSKIACIASFNLKDILCHKTGKALPPHKLSRHVLEAIKDYKEITTKEGSIIHEYKVYDKFLALEKLKEYKVALLEMEKSVKESSKSIEDSNKVHLKINGLNIPIKKLSELSKKVDGKEDE